MIIFLLHGVNPMGLISAQQLVPSLEEINPVTFPGNIFADLQGNDIDHTLYPNTSFDPQNTP